MAGAELTVGLGYSWAGWDPGGARPGLLGLTLKNWIKTLLGHGRYILDTVYIL